MGIFSWFSKRKALKVAVSEETKILPDKAEIEKEHEGFVAEAKELEGLTTRKKYIKKR
jgi:hypothetical protein